MSSTVKLRKKANNNDDKNRSRPLSGPLYLGRPKSWGEFQSSLSKFQSVSHPRTSTSSDEPTRVGEPESEQRKEFDETIIRRRSTTVQALQPRKSDAFRTRPLSELLVPTPFYKTYQIPAAGSNKSYGPNNKCESSSSGGPVSLTIDENTDMPSLVFEEALETKETAVSPTTDVKTTLPEIDHKPELIELSKENNARKSKVDSPSDSGVPESAERGNSASTSCYSDVSSIVDTGFYSLDGKENSPEIPDPEINFTLNKKENNKLFPSHEISSSEESKEGQRKIPSPLYSCYSNNSYSLGRTETYGEPRRPSSRSSGSKLSFSSSIDISDEENAKEIFSSRNSRDKGHPDASISDQSNSSTDQKTSGQAGLLLPTKYAYDHNAGIKDVNNLNNTLPKSLLDSSDYDSVDGVIPSKGLLPQITNKEGVIKNKEDFSSKEDKFQQQLEISCSDQRIPNGSSFSKDDQNTTIGRSSPTSEVEIDAPILGTWPRRVKRSKRKQDQKEAEELMRRFRATSEAYRSRFRNIYAESRRKIEETILGLREAMAKNGYSDKYYQTKEVKGIQ